MATPCSCSYSPSNTTTTTELASESTSTIELLVILAIYIFLAVSFIVFFAVLGVASYRKWLERRQIRLDEEAGLLRQEENLSLKHGHGTEKDACHCKDVDQHSKHVDQHDENLDEAFLSFEQLVCLYRFELDLMEGVILEWLEWLQRGCPVSGWNEHWERSETSCDPRKCICWMDPSWCVWHGSCQSEQADAPV